MGVAYYDVDTNHQQSHYADDDNRAAEQQSPTECPFNGDQVIRTAADCLRPINFNVNMLGCLAMYSSNNNTFRPYYHPHPPWHAAPIPLTRVQYRQMEWTG